MKIELDGNVANIEGKFKCEILIFNKWMVFYFGFILEVFWVGLYGYKIFFNI